MSARTLADYLAAQRLAAAPNAPATLTPPALADWLADHPDAWTADAPHGSPADRTAALAAHVSRATLRAALQGPDAMESLAAAIPQPAAPAALAAAADPWDALAAMFAPLVDSSIPPDLAGMAWIHALWQWAHADAPDLKHPVAPLAAAYLDAHRPQPAALVVYGSPGYARQPAAAGTVALATWERAPDVHAVLIDGEPVATEAPLRPVRAVRPDGQLFALPGTRDADSLILRRLKALDAAGVERRAALPADTYATLALACALTGPATLTVEQFGAWLGQRDLAAVRSERQRIDLRRRAWSALDAARAHFVTPDGQHLALLDVRTVNLPLGTVRLHGWNWAAARSAGLGWWTLTGALAHIGVRADAYGSIGRFVAALEDYAASGGQASRADRRAPHLIPERPGGPGPAFTVAAYDLLARAGYVWDGRDERQAAKMRQTWRRVRQALEQRGYVLGRGQSESVAGDTVEVLRFNQRGRSSPTLTARASARFCAAYAYVNRSDRRPPGVDAHGLDAWPLDRLLSGAS